MASSLDCYATSSTNYLLAVQSPDPVLIVDKAGQVYVYTKEGEKLYTGLDMPMPLPEGQQALYEVLRELGLRCARL